MKKGDVQYGALLALVLFFLLALTLFFIFKKMLAGGAP